jgi:hypothetical protein
MFRLAPWLLLFVSTAALAAPTPVVAAPSRPINPWGAGLAGAGAALLAGTPVVITLIGALTSQDDGRNAPTPWVEDFTQVNGLIVLAASAVGAVGLAAGGAILLGDALADDPVPAATIVPTTVPVEPTPPS